MLKKSVLVIGAGAWGQNIINTLVTEIGVGTLHIVHRRTQDHERLRAMFPAAVVLSHLAEFKATIDLAIVATQISSQSAILRELAERRIPTLVEKPFCGPLSEARDISELYRANATPLFVDNIYLHSPSCTRFAELFRREFAGSAFVYSGRRWDFGSFPTDVGILSHLLYHDLSILNELVGLETLRIEGYRAYDQLYSLLTLGDRNGSLYDLSASQISASKHRLTSVTNRRACLEWDDTNADDPVRLTTLDVAAKSKTPARSAPMPADRSALGAVITAALDRSSSVNYASVDVALKIKGFIQDIENDTRVLRHRSGL